jgi:cytochrome c peroxidase
MHDGSLQTLDEVIEHYVAGGKHSKGQHPSILRFQLTAREKKQLISFLGALTDTSYLKNF